MKIVAINSSHRGDKGYTKFLLDLLLNGASEAGANCEIISLANLKINPCSACQICHSDKYNLQCIYNTKDDVKNIFNKMAEADLIVFATPVYVFGMTGLMKTFLDRLNSTGNSNDLRLSKSGLIFHHINHQLCSKPFVILVCCDNLEDETPKNVISYFHTYSKFMDAPIVGTLVRKSGKIAGHGKDANKLKIYPKLKEIYEAYHQAGKDLVVQGKIKHLTQKKANQNFLPIPRLANFLMKYKFFKVKMFHKIKLKTEQI